MEPIETPPSEAPRSRGRLNSTIVATGAAVALTLAGLGIAGAQTGSSSTTTPEPAASTEDGKPADAQGRRGPGKGHHLGVRQGSATVAKIIGISEADLKTALRSGQSIADVAKSKNVDVQKVIDAMVAEAKKHLADKVAAGELTQAQADQRSATLTERITAFVNHDGQRPGRHQGPGKHHHRGAKVGMAVAAQTIGVSEADLKTALRSGQSIADVAKSKNVDVQKVIDALVAEAKKNLADKVAAGDLTQAQVDQKSANLAERITALVNHARPGGEHRRGFRGPGSGGDAPASAPTATNA